jgi:hypothetical protein
MVMLQGSGLQRCRAQGEHSLGVLSGWHLSPVLALERLGSVSLKIPGIG